MYNSQSGRRGRRTDGRASIVVYIYLRVDAYIQLYSHITIINSVYYTSVCVYVCVRVRIIYVVNNIFVRTHIHRNAVKNHT